MIIIDQYLALTDYLINGWYEFLKFAILETYLLIGQLFDSVFAILLYLFFDIKNFFTLGNKALKTSTAKDLNQILEKSPASSDSSSILPSQIDTVSDITCASYLQTRQRCSLFKFLFQTLLKLVFLPIYILFRPKPPPNNALKNLKTSIREQEASGLLEDITHNILEFCDICAETSRLFVRFRPISGIQILYRGFWECFRLSNLTRNYDDRPISELVQDIGYPYERILCETEDGYLLHTDRLVRRKTKDVLLFVHGITDSGLMWLGSDPQRSIACKSYEKGFDVFLLNFRGCGGSTKHKNDEPDETNKSQDMNEEEESEETDKENEEVEDPEKNESQSPPKPTPTPKKQKHDFWNFTLNDLMFRDMKAAIETIVSVKMKELGVKDRSKLDLRLQIIAHSMGGGMTIGHIIHSRLQQKEHLIKRVVLLAPCGIHREMPTFWTLLTRILVWYCWIFRASYLGLHSIFVRKLFAKFAQDLIGRSSARSIISMFMSKLMVGGRAKKSPVFHVHNICYHMLNGVSYGVLCHFEQLVRCGDFRGFDFGSKTKNMEVYGTESPISFFKHYHLIDIPIVVVSGEDDRIIPAVDVRRHYIQLVKTRNDDRFNHKYRSVPNAGHIDLSWSMSEELLKYLEEQIMLPFFEGEFSYSEDSSGGLSDSSDGTRSRRREDVMRKLGIGVEQEIIDEEEEIFEEETDFVTDDEEVDEFLEKEE